MLGRIVTFLLMPCLIVAVYLSISGVVNVPFDNTLYSFVSGVINERFKNFLVAIPSIPKIPSVNYSSGGGFEILTVLIAILNVIITVINGLVTLINVIITTLNYIIALVEYIVIFIWSVVDLKNVLLQAQQQATVIVSL